MIGGFLYFKYNASSPDNIVEANVINRSVLELTPLPILSSNNSSQKNTLLYDMLLHKSGQDVILQDVNVELGGLKRFFPIALEKLRLEVVYNADEERLEFSGGSELGAKISGHCSFDDRNSIAYHVELVHDTNRIFLQLRHDPNDDKANSNSFGEFIWEASVADIIKLVSNTEIHDTDESLSLQGKFFLKGDKLELSDVILNNNKIESSAILKNISTTKPNLSIKTITHSVNLDFFAKFLKDPILVQELIRNLSDLDLELVVKAANANLKNANLKNLRLNLHNKEGSIDIKSISFDFSNGGSFFSRGTVHDHKFSPEYVGEVQITKAMSNEVHGMIYDEKPHGDLRVDITSKVRLKPSLIIMDGLQIRENDFSLKSKRLKSIFFHNVANLIVGDLELNKPLEKSQFLSNLLKQYSGEKSSVDLDLVLDSGISGKNISMNYMVSPNVIRVSNIVVDQGLSGNMAIDLRQKTLNGNLSGEVREWQSLMRGIVSVANFGFNGIGNDAFSKNFKDFKGSLVVNAKNIDKNFAGDLKCRMDYKLGKAQLADCFMNTLGGKLSFEGSAVVRGSNIKYDVDYNGSGLSLQSLVASGLMDSSSISAKDARGNFSLHGHLQSVGVDMVDVLKNVISKSELEFKEASVNGDVFKAADKKAKSTPFYLSGGSIETNWNSILGEFFGAKDSNKPSLFKFSYDLIKKATTTTIL